MLERNKQTIHFPLLQMVLREPSIELKYFQKFYKANFKQRLSRGSLRRLILNYKGGGKKVKLWCLCVHTLMDEKLPKVTRFERPLLDPGKFIPSSK